MKYLVLASLLFAGCADSQLTIENDSSYSFQQINLAPVDQVTWGSNLIPDMLLPSESLHISQIDCGNYDVRLTTDAGSECILSNLSLCFDNAIWTIDNTELASCAF